MISLRPSLMFELRTFGAVDLRAPDGHPVNSVLAQPKRLALLVYLAVARPGGFVRRDTLLALLWPDSDTDRGRGALRQAVRYLRRSLGEDFLLSRGEDEIGIAPGALSCDAVRFREALAGGEGPMDPTAALALHDSEFLEGFHLDGAPDFERWVDREREGLRVLATGAAAGLAEAAATEGRWSEAAGFARRALAIDPLGEHHLRRLIGILASGGDRSGALSEFELFRGRLAEELELDPDEETRGLVARIRAGEVADVSEAKVAEPLPVEPSARASLPSEAAIAGVASPGEGTTAPASPPPPVTTTYPAVGGGFRSVIPGAGIGRGLATALVVGIGIVAATWFTTRSPAPPPSINAVEARRLVVSPFTNETGVPELDPVGLMTADWITEGVSRLGNFEVVPATAVLAVQEDGADRPIDPLRLAQLTGAGILVTGRYYRSGASLYFQAQLLDGRSGQVLRAVAPAFVEADSLLLGVADIRERILDALVPMSDTVSHLRTAVDPPRYEAYLAYIQALDAFVRTDLADAMARWERAIELDPGYPLPRVAIGIALFNLGEYARGDTVLAPVLARRHELGPLEAGTLDLALGMLRGDILLRRDAMEITSRVAPGTINEYQVGEIARQMNHPRRAIEVLEGLGPDGGEIRGWPPYWRELTHAHLMIGDAEAALASVREGRRRHPGNLELIRFEVEVLGVLGRVDEIDALIEARTAFPPGQAPTLEALLRIAAAGLDGVDPESARRLRDRAITRYESFVNDPAAAPEAALGWATTLIELGDLVAAREVLSRVPAWGGMDREVPAPQSSIEVEATGLLGRIAALNGDAATARYLSDLIVSVPPREGLTGIVDPWWSRRVRLQAGILAALGDTDEAVSALRRAHAAGESFSSWWRIDPLFAELHGSPAFEALLRPEG